MQSLNDKLLDHFKNPSWGKKPVGYPQETGEAGTLPSTSAKLPEKKFVRDLYSPQPPLPKKSKVPPKNRAELQC